MSDLLIEKKHMDMMKYAVNKINQLPKKERVLADMMRDHTYTCRWKGIDGFVELTAPQIIAIADAVRAHVQLCFDHEAELLPLIESAETEAELEAISW